MTMDQLDNIQNLIYVIRGQRVMLDFDLAKTLSGRNFSSHTSGTTKHGTV